MKKRKPRPYHILLSIDGSPGCSWAMEFGAYDLTDVKAELEDYRDRGWKRRELKIVTILDGAKQSLVDDAVRAANEAAV